MILNRFKKRVRKLVVVTGLLLLAGAIQAPSTANITNFGPMTAYAAEQQVSAPMSARWYDAGNHIWKVKTKDGTGFLKNTWFQDDVTGEWYLLGDQDGTVMYAGLVTDTATGKTYLLDTEHVGYYGRMLHTDGAYTINGKTVYLTFDQEHNGTFGAITSGLNSVRSTGITEKSLSEIPMDLATQNHTQTTAQDTGSNTSKQELKADLSWAEKYKKADGTYDWSRMTRTEQEAIVEAIQGGTVGHLDKNVTMDSSLANMKLNP